MKENEKYLKYKRNKNTKKKINDKKRNKLSTIEGDRVKKMKEIENYLKYKRNKNTKNKINGKNVNCQQIDCSHILMATWYSFLEHIIVQVQASGGTKCLKS